MKVTVRLNGTDKNPYAAMGLHHNPFPAIPKAEYGAANVILASLNAEPIHDEQDLRERLDGCTDEFVQLCVNHFKPGERVKFDVEWKDSSDY